MAQYSKIGFHMSTTGNRAGWGDYVRALDAAGIPAVCMTVGGEGVGDIIGCWNNGSNVPHVVGVRYMPEDGSQDVPPYNTPEHQAAVDWWGWLYQRIGNDVKAYRDRVWIVTGNELDKNHADWCGRFYVELANIMRADGFKLCALNYGPGEPEPEHWETPGMLAYLRLCAEQPDCTAVGLHEYALGDDLEAAYPHHIGRFLALFSACDEHNISRPRVLIGEFGWRQDSVPSDAMGQVPFAAELYARYPEILGAGIWTLQDWTGCPPQCVQELILPMQNYNLTARFPDPAPIPPPTPLPGHDYKSVVFKLAQEHTRQEWQEIAGLAYDEYKRTLTASADNCRVMVTDGNSESYAVVFDPELPSQQATIQLLQEAGLTYQARPFGDSSPLDGLVLGHLFPYRYILTNPFNAPRSYGNGKHEGADYDVIGGIVNNTTAVLCTYDGTVDRSLDSDGGYGKYVRVTHQRNGKPFYTRYCHLDARYVTVGQTITKGTAVGEVGTTGNVLGEHVHFNLEVPGYGLPGYVVADVVNPEPYMQPGRNSLPPVPSGNNIDMLPYLRGDGRLYEVKNANGGQERFQTQLKPGGVFWQTKNGLAEKLYDLDGFIWRDWDTSPGNGRFYRQQQNGQNGARWMPRSLAVGQSYTVGIHVQFYTWNCSPSAPNSGDVTDTRRLVAHYPSYTFRTGIVLPDVIKIEWVNGGEVYFYARNYGLVAWERSHQDPNTPQWSAISEEHAPGARPDNQVDLPSCLG